MKLIYCFLFLLISCSSNSDRDTKLPFSFDGIVTSIKDGDTFKVLYNKKEINIRLEHIDCPEKGQPFGKNAKQFASDLCFFKAVTVKNNGKYDRYKRLIAEIYLNDICINKELVKSGFAWHFKKYSDNKDYDKLEKTARETNIGLWLDIKPIAPWEWRAK